MQKNIFHIHDQVCKHASNTLEDIVSYALKHGYKKLYFTEHNPISIKCPYQARRASHENMVEFVKRINEVNKKYKGKLHIYFGYETEFNKQNRWYYERLARDPLPDYFIAGNHFYGDLFAQDFAFDFVMHRTTSHLKFKEMLENFHAAMASGLYTWVAHPDIFLKSYRKWDKYSIAASKQIIKWAIKYKLPLGFNLNWSANEPKDEWHYPCEPFWKLVAKTNIPVIVESDSHDHHTITKEWIEQGRRMAISWGLKKNIIDDVKLNLLPKRPLMVLYEKQLFNCISQDILINLKKNKVKFVEVNSNTNIQKIFLSNGVHPVWTIALVNNAKLLKQIKKTAAFVVSHKMADLSLKEFKKLTYKQFINCFVKEP